MPWCAIATNNSSDPGLIVLEAGIAQRSGGEFDGAEHADQEVGEHAAEDVGVGGAAALAAGAADLGGLGDGVTAERWRRAVTGLADQVEQEWPKVVVGGQNAGAQLVVVVQRLRPHDPAFKLGVRLFHLLDAAVDVLADNGVSGGAGGAGNHRVDVRVVDEAQWLVAGPGAFETGQVEVMSSRRMASAAGLAKRISSFGTAIRTASFLALSSRVPVPSWLLATLLFSPIQ